MIKLTLEQVNKIKGIDFSGRKKKVLRKKEEFLFKLRTSFPATPATAAESEAKELVLGKIKRFSVFKEEARELTSGYHYFGELKMISEYIATNENSENEDVKNAVDVLKYFVSEFKSAGNTQLVINSANVSDMMDVIEFLNEEKMF